MFVFLLMLNVALAKPQEKAVPTLEVCATVNHIEALQEERSEIERTLASMPVTTPKTDILGEDVWETTLSAVRSRLTERKKENKRRTEEATAQLDAALAENDASALDCPATSR